MAFNEMLAKLRKERGLTQGELAKKLYVTRQAVSRWENGDTTPGIDMVKLISVVLEVPIARLLEMPDYPVCQSCGMPLIDAAEFGTEADGTPSPEYCKHCYARGSYRYEATMEELIEGCAPFMAHHTGMSLDEAISLMGIMLPSLKRWHVVHENELRFGEEARELYGDQAVDDTNRRLMEMDEVSWNTKEELELAIIQELTNLLRESKPTSNEAQQLAAMHASWIKMHWGEAAYCESAHVSLAESYLADVRFTEYYDSRAGEGATRFLVEAIRVYCGL